MKRHFAWFKFLWGSSLVLIAFLSLAATFQTPFNFLKADNLNYSAQQKDFLMNPINVPAFDSSSTSKRHSPIETAWQSYRAVSISS